MAGNVIGVQGMSIKGSHLMKRKIYLFSVLMTALLLSACASTPMTWDGAKLPKEQVATIDKKEWRIGILTINGKPQQIHRWTSGGSKLEPFPRVPGHYDPGYDFYIDKFQILPGPTELIVGYSTTVTYSTKTQRINFNAIAGGEYIVDYWRKGSDWGAYMIEKSTNRTIEGVAVENGAATGLGHDLPMAHSRTQEEAAKVVSPVAAETKENAGPTRWASIVLDIVTAGTDKSTSEFARAALTAFPDREGAFVMMYDMQSTIEAVIHKYGKPDSQEVRSEDPRFEAYNYGRLRLYTKVGSSAIEGLEAPIGWLADGIRTTAKTALEKSKQSS